MNSEIFIPSHLNLIEYSPGFEPPKGVHTKILKLLSDSTIHRIQDTPIETLNKKDLRYIETLLSQNNRPLSKKERMLINLLHEKHWKELLNIVYNLIIKLKISEKNSTSLKLLNYINTKYWHEDENIDYVWKYKTCNDYWVPFIQDWNRFIVLNKINHDLVYGTMWMHITNEKKIYWQYLNENNYRIYYWYSKEKSKYTSLNKIEWKEIISTQGIIRNENWKVIYGDYKYEWIDYWIPFWFSSKTKWYKSLQIEWANIFGTKDIVRNKSWKVLYGRFINQDNISIPFWLEWDKYISLKIEWEYDIKEFKNIKRDANWKVLSWKIIIDNWEVKKFELEWWKYIISNWILKRFKNLFNKK